MFCAKPMPPRPTLDENEIEEAFLKGSGPGGQKINKTSSAVQLKHLPSGIVIKSQATRSRTQNRKIARRLLAEKLEEIQLGDQSRRAVKAQVAKKKKASADKKKRRKYRALEESKVKPASNDMEQGANLEDDADMTALSEAAEVAVHSVQSEDSVKDVRNEDGDRRTGVTNEYRGNTGGQA
ncbi:MAG: hypothetical protein M1821_009153 [Bathelium mastoideum]|nr:MAG: hypothetical protein M1821_009153 [Bathelium mastoideum]KAI9689528.1 MAG: hypothetical protein M1822_010179 [Bathelium mastoideum]